MASMLTNLEPMDVLFIDEIHRLSPTIEELLYSAMEDGELDIILGQGVGAKKHQAATGAIYPYRCNYQNRVIDVSTTGPVWHSTQAGLL